MSKLYSAILRSVSGRFSTYLIQFGALAIYARMFSPNEFGIIASIQVFVVFFQMLADVGIGPAIINEKGFGQERRDGIFTVTALLGVVISIAFYFFSFLLNGFYNGYEYQSIAILVCVAIFFNALNIVPLASLNKDTKFTHIAVVDIFVEVIALILVYFLYTKQVGVLSLAARPMIQAMSRFVIFWILSVNTTIGRPCFGNEIYHFKSILEFSSYQFGFNFINYFSRNLDNILVAKYFGMITIGVYEKSYQLMRYPLMVTTFAMAPAIQPVLTCVRDDVKYVVCEHNKLASRLFALSLLISVFFFINSQDLILFLFGERWLDIVPLIQIFSLSIPLQSVLSTSGAFFQVMNKPKLLFFSGVLSAVFNVLAIVIGIYLGNVKYVALALLASFTINFFQSYWILFKFCFKSNIFKFYSSLIRGCMSVIVPLLVYLTLYTSGFLNFEFLPFFNLVINAILIFVFIAVTFKYTKRLLLI
ncbi:hypothetical protein BBM55_05715 [Vibrio parahaemolyticus]|uniref:oligosaccharide flippase family protein n=1 Tax=Vibrio parahaemolyticus TaxID=670 RepID=UPI00084A3451|nr:oligosaccharide flippase family protein [Vibrio parahaemolyticus]OEA22297.1 hypothetical protein BBM55_05715 [Vibrio parahaemolyticus]